MKADFNEARSNWKPANGISAAQADDTEEENAPDQEDAPSNDGAVPESMPEEDQSFLLHSDPFEVEPEITHPWAPASTVGTRSRHPTRL